MDKQKQLTLSEWPDFLPEGPFSTDELHRLVRTHIRQVLELVPQVDAPEMTITELEKLPLGCYVLPRKPSLQFLRELPNFHGGKSEVGVCCLQGQWLVTTIESGQEFITRWPELISAAKRSGLCQMDIHSHPGDDGGSRLPSFSDICRMNEAIDRKMYIACRAGLLEIVFPETLPGGYTHPTDISRSWDYWILTELKLTHDEYCKRGRALERDFYKQFFGMRIIPWSESEEIDKRITQGELLRKEY